MSDDTSAIQAAIDAAAEAGGGTVSLPAGVHRSGSLRLRSHVELKLEAGARLQFVADPSLYPPVQGWWEGAPSLVHQPCLYASGETDVAVTGFGSIDGEGEPWWRFARGEGGRLEHPRPTLMGLHHCEHVTIRDVTLRQSPGWTVHVLRCDGVTLDNLHIANPPGSPNTDGIDVESSRNVRISNCHIDVADDCIALKSGTEASPDRVPCENVSITNCTLRGGRGGVAIGSEMSGGVRNVLVSSCVLVGVDSGIHLKTRRGRGGRIEDVRVTGLVMSGVRCPVVVNPFYRYGRGGAEPRVADRAAQPVDDATPLIRRIHLAHVSAGDVHVAAAFLYGLPEQPLDDLTIDDFHVSFADDARPGRPAMAEGVPVLARGGLLVGFLRDAALSHVRITGADGPLVVSEAGDEVLDGSGVTRRWGA